MTISPQHSRICAKHFLKPDYHPYSRYLIKTAVPSIFDFPKHLQKTSPVPRSEIVRNVPPSTTHPTQTHPTQSVRNVPPSTTHPTQSVRNVPPSTTHPTQMYVRNVPPSTTHPTQSVRNVPPSTTHPTQSVRNVPPSTTHPTQSVRNVPPSTTHPTQSVRNVPPSTTHPTQSVRNVPPSTTHPTQSVRNVPPSTTHPTQSVRNVPPSTTHPTQSVRNVPPSTTHPTQSVRNVPPSTTHPTQSVRNVPPSTTHPTQSEEPPPKKIKSPTKEELNETIRNLKKELKTLRQKVKRRKEKITSLKGIVENLRDKSSISDETAINLEENFTGMSSELIKNQLKNQARNPKGRRYCDEVKRFALTLNFYSLRAYEYFRSVFSLPHANSLIEWTSSVDCEPGIFIDVFKSLKEKIDDVRTHADCALLCDAMTIKSAVTYNHHSTGNYEGYVDYGDGIKVPDENSVATEATVFMPVSFRGHWKYPIGYVLDDHLTAKDLKCLLSRCLDLCAENGIKVKCITMDGTSVNLNAMKLFGCKFGDSLGKIDGTFFHNSFDCIYFIADPPHMLKLARNALGEMKVFIDD